MSSSSVSSTCPPLSAATAAARSRSSLFVQTCQHSGCTWTSAATRRSHRDYCLTVHELSIAKHTDHIREDWRTCPCCTNLIETGAWTVDLQTCTPVPARSPVALPHGSNPLFSSSLSCPAAPASSSFSSVAFPPALIVPSPPAPLWASERSPFDVLHDDHLHYLSSTPTSTSTTPTPNSSTPTPRALSPTAVAAIGATTTTTTTTTTTSEFIGRTPPAGTPSPPPRSPPPPQAAFVSVPTETALFAGPTQGDSHQGLPRHSLTSVTMVLPLEQRDASLSLPPCGPTAVLVSVRRRPKRSYAEVACTTLSSSPSSLPVSEDGSLLADMEVGDHRGRLHGRATAHCDDDDDDDDDEASDGGIEEEKKKEEEKVEESLGCYGSAHMKVVVKVEEQQVEEDDNADEEGKEPPAKRRRSSYHETSLTVATHDLSTSPCESAPRPIPWSPNLNCSEATSSDTVGREPHCVSPPTSASSVGSARSVPSTPHASSVSGLEEDIAVTFSFLQQIQLRLSSLSVEGQTAKLSEWRGTLQAMLTSLDATTPTVSGPTTEVAASCRVLLSAWLEGNVCSSEESM